jgi:hypothetical protein
MIASMATVFAKKVVLTAVALRLNRTQLNASPVTPDWHALTLSPLVSRAKLLWPRMPKSE